MNRIKVLLNGECIIDNQTDGEYVEMAITKVGDQNFFVPHIVRLTDGDELSVDVTKVKPPLGIVPEVIWYEQRIQEIEEAIERFTQVGKDIPIEWTLELLELTKVLL